MNNQQRLETPLVEGGQGRKGESMTPNAVTVVVAIIGGAVLLAWAVWSCL